MNLMMPPGQYGDDREVAFEMIARQYELRPVTLRVLLSNVFVSMARQGRIRS